ncbi:MAG: TetR/AcrR family transcriptional regulator [Acidobacteriota bacterium]|nr:TetR/AcrR family transcriptional regulator [Acidobacteriota bacterium]MDH3529631.1 TetR/AcrR family transcriptional regulator [Acidobacteriota bacterium]
MEKGKQTRSEILSESVDIASAEGLEGLTIGRLAKDLKMSKSGLFAHFGSKEDLQIATVRRARDVFIEEIVAPASKDKRGLERLEALLDNWIKYVESGVFRGGCFFFAVSAEMDDRPGRVRDLIAHLTMSWVTVIEDEVKTAIELGELRSDCDAELLAYQFHGFVQEANWFYRLHGRTRAFQHARDSIAETLSRYKKNNS